MEGKTDRLVVAVTGASGAVAARLLLDRSPFPVELTASRAGKAVYEQEAGPFSELARRAAAFHEDDDLSAPIASGSVPTRGMVIIPCSVNTLGKIAAGVCDSLITRAAHCHLKERRRLVLCVRETPWSYANARAAAEATAAGAVVMPMSPPFYMAEGRDPREVTMEELLGYYVDRVLALFGRRPPATWADRRAQG